MKNLIPGTILLLFATCSCDYVESYYYEVANSTDQTVEITIVRDMVPPDEDSVIVERIPSGTSREIFFHPGGICGRREHPARLNDLFHFRRVTGTQNDTLIMRTDLAVDSNWNYRTEEREGFYTYEIRPEDF